MLAGCPRQSLRQDMQGWVGRDASSLVAAWGPPARIVALEGGGRIFIYRFDRSHRVPGRAYSHRGRRGDRTLVRVTYMPAHLVHHVQLRMFWLDGKDHVTRWAIKN